MCILKMKLRNYSPLRYPGGKAKLYSDVKTLIEGNYKTVPTYAEPFAGGAGLALKLLMTGVVKEIHLNDLDYGLFSFWYSALNETEKLIKLINDTEVTVEEWKNQKEIYNDPSNNDRLTKGFSTFYLNRCNRSGIMNAGVIGGLKQEGKYKIYDRFNKVNLIKIIESISLFKDKIHLYNLDYEEFLLELDSKNENCFIFLDPPYVVKGHQLYGHHFDMGEHEKLFNVVKGLNNLWLLTYDDDEYKDMKTTEIAEEVKSRIETAIFQQLEEITKNLDLAKSN